MYVRGSSDDDGVNYGEANVRSACTVRRALSWWYTLRLGRPNLTLSVHQYSTNGPWGPHEPLRGHPFQLTGSRAALGPRRLSREESGNGTPDIRRGSVAEP